MKVERRHLSSRFGPCGFRGAGFMVAWICVFLIAAYDIYFAWSFRDTFASWELNPLVRWAVETVGLFVVFGFRLAALVFVSALVWHCRKQRRAIACVLTVFVVGVHAALAAHYVIGHQQPTNYD